MPRDPRSFDTREIYHLNAHAVDDRRMFGEDLDCQDFVIRLGRVVTTERWHVYAVCLMDTHHHLVLGPTLGRVSDGMKVLHGAFSRAFNRRHARRGALFESRFYAKRIEDDAHFFEVIRYVAQNPVEAGLVERPQDWPWSTYGQVVGTQRRWPFFDPLRVIELFGSMAALRSYVELVSDTFKGV
jgi:REP element-mobilizing transposase RayT